MRRRILLGVTVVVAFLALAGSAAALPEPPTGQIDLLAGTVAGFAPPGDNVLAIIARVNGPTDVAAMPDGSVLIADGTTTASAGSRRRGSSRRWPGTVPRATPATAVQATAATISGPTAVASTGDGGFLIADINNRVVRRVTPAGTITTAAGTGPGNNCASVFPACGDGGAATSATLSFPTDVAATPTAAS